MIQKMDRLDPRVGPRALGLGDLLFGFSRASEKSGGEQDISRANESAKPGPEPFGSVFVGDRSYTSIIAPNDIGNYSVNCQ